MITASKEPRSLVYRGQHLTADSLFPACRKVLELSLLDCTSGEWTMIGSALAQSAIRLQTLTINQWDNGDRVCEELSKSQTLTNLCLSTSLQMQMVAS